MQDDWPLSREGSLVNDLRDAQTEVARLRKEMKVAIDALMDLESKLTELERIRSRLSLGMSRGG